MTFAHVLKVGLFVQKSDDPKKKRKYKYVLKVPTPANTLPGWQEVTMDIERIDRSFDMTRQRRE